MDETAQFARDGYVVLEHIFDAAFADELRAEYLRQFPDVTSSSDRYKVGNRRIQVPITMKGPYLSPDLYANPELLRLARGLLGENFLIDSLAIVTALPRAKMQHLHKDHEDLSPGNEVVRALMGAYAVTIAIPLVDLTPETGTTRLFTRSHLRPLREEEFALPYIERGRAYAMDYRLWHQGTQNRSGTERPIIYLVYAKPWFTDISNYGAANRIRIASEDLTAVSAEHQPLFRRLSPERWTKTSKFPSRQANSQ